MLSDLRDLFPCWLTVHDKLICPPTCRKINQNANVLSSCCLLKSWPTTILFIALFHFHNIAMIKSCKGSLLNKTDAETLVHTFKTCHFSLLINNLTYSWPGEGVNSHALPYWHMVSPSSDYHWFCLVAKLIQWRKLCFLFCRVVWNLMVQHSKYIKFQFSSIPQMSALSKWFAFGQWRNTTQKHCLNLLDLREWIY